MSTTRIRMDDPSTFPKGRIDAARVDATTEAEIAAQEREDEAEALQDISQLGAGQALPDRRGARPVAGARQGPRRLHFAY